jgi:hypothetical protein
VLSLAKETFLWVCTRRIFSFRCASLHIDIFLDKLWFKLF